MSEDLWVFGYGSLIWRPGFDYAERRRARLHGWRRRFCMASMYYRGTPEAPGLVLALDADTAGVCEGVAYRVGAEAAEAVIAYLRERELVSYAYHEIRHPVDLEEPEGEAVEAVCYVIDREHSQYRGGLSLEEQAAVIARAVGPMGPNREYLANTIASLEALGLHDPDLARLAELVTARG
jgi:glutathione-specific gamma-glutamylcyclotransferase